MPHHFFTIGYSENLPCPTISSLNLPYPSISSLFGYSEIAHAPPFLHYWILRKSSMPHHFFTKSSITQHIFTILLLRNRPCPTISSLLDTQKIANAPSFLHYWILRKSPMPHHFFTIGYSENLPCPTISSVFDTQKIVHAPPFLHYWILRKSPMPHHFFTIGYSENLPFPTISSRNLPYSSISSLFGNSEIAHAPPFLHYWILRKSSMPHHFFTKSSIPQHIFTIRLLEKSSRPTIFSLLDTQKILHAPPFLHYWILRKSPMPHHFFTIRYSENLPDPPFLHY